MTSAKKEEKELEKLNVSRFNACEATYANYDQEIIAAGISRDRNQDEYDSTAADLAQSTAEL